jgi:hypothetical protein
MIWKKVSKVKKQKHVKRQYDKNGAFVSTSRFKVTRTNKRDDATREQGCQIFVGRSYQNGGEMYQMTAQYTKWP